MEYFLVKGIVYATEYMEKENKFEDIRLVKADSKEEALEKYDNYWSSKTSEYSVYYFVHGEVIETIS